jgi:hypothetical protein
LLVAGLFGQYWGRVGGPIGLGHVKLKKEELDMGKDEKSAEESRKTRLRTLALKCGTPGVSQVIPFRNDDVPKFLERIREFMERSKKKQLFVK